MKHSILWDFGEPFAREPVLRRMPNGDLLCTFLTGGPKEPHPKNLIKYTRSADDGNTWSQPKVLFRHSARGVWCTELFTHGDAPMMAIQTYKNDRISYRELQTFRSFALDERGERWSEPKSFPNGMNGVSVRQGIVLSNGDWLFPVYWQEVTRDFDWHRQSAVGEGEAWPFRCGVAISGDRGASYERHGYLRGTHGLWENNCVELESGHVAMLMRSNAGSFLMRADSYDYGRSWTEARETSLPNPNTKLSLVKIRGTVYLLNNFAPGYGWDKRRALELRRLNDCLACEGKPLPLEAPDAHFFYPHAYADDDRQTLYVAYENAHQHRLCRIPYDELPGGEL